MSVSLICVSLLAFLVMGLAFQVSMARRQTNTVIGHNSDPKDPLYKAIRAHSNATEYVPIIALLIYILGTMPISSWVLWCMVLITVFRYVAAAGLLFPHTLEKPNALRFVGALGTYVVGFLLCIALLLKALTF